MVVNSEARDNACFGAAGLVCGLVLAGGAGGVIQGPADGL
jgi:hypothetical protein